MKKKKSKEAIQAYHGNKDDSIRTDVLGSYTGEPTQETGEVPVQDADDL